MQDNTEILMEILKVLKEINQELKGRRDSGIEKYKEQKEFYDLMRKLSPMKRIN